MRTHRVVALGAITTSVWLAACSGRLTVLVSNDAGTPNPDGNQGTPITAGAGGSSAGSGGSGPAGAGGDAGASGEGGSSTGGAAGATGGSAGSSTGGAAGDGPGGAAGTGGAAGGGGMAGEDASCLATSYDVKVLPNDLYIVANSSWSMDCPWGAPSPGCNHLDAGPVGGPTRWSVLSDAINEAAPFLAGRGAALGLLFAPRVVAGGTACLLREYASAVGLPGSAEGVMKALAQQPRGGASLLALPLESAILDATVYLRENPTRRVQLAAVFDGESDFRPCADDTLDRAVSMATAGYTSSPPIRSTIIGIGSQLVDLHKVAIAGGTDQARLITVQGVADATHEIAYALRAAATPCEIAIPDGARTPGAFDPTRLNVETMLATVAQRRIQYQVAGASSCEQSNQRDGWYYDDPSKPAKVVFCPATCASLGFDDDPGVSFLVGCPTKPRPPPN